MKTNLDTLIESAENLCKTLEMSCAKNKESINTLNLQIAYLLSQADKIKRDLEMIKSFTVGAEDDGLFCTMG